ncbi:MerR family transcriptional regulator [Alteraurantiacibacter aquimixticola]|uniref:MerR family transcriptional regulator n=1 Tax=Alteraurantiacibacter aquimixticola TaxID=2489173 RepID=A0A4T3F5V5_9SPHN|nr:MerR family transcriptional regulator [Alteraurantiacibacter aquimixticola]TIX51869.1 MerR family transcriptional regulator [Alteraurantiacibacter aquimixticola]
MTPAFPFDDGKDADAMRTIGEVARGLGIKQHILRYWEQQFPMLQPLKRSGGRRLYRPSDVELVARIDALINREGYTLKGAKQVLQSAGSAGAEPAAREASPAPAQAVGKGLDILPQLKALRARLSAAIEAA